MANQPYQGNRPQQQSKPQQTNVAPGTTHTIPEATISVDTTEVEEPLDLQEDSEEEFFNSLTPLQQFKRIVASGLEDVIKGLVTPRELKNDIRAWFEELTTDQATEYREQLKDAAKYIQSQVEDVLNETPQLVM